MQLFQLINRLIILKIWNQLTTSQSHELFSLASPFRIRVTLVTKAKKITYVAETPTVAARHPCEKRTGSRGSRL